MVSAMQMAIGLKCEDASHLNRADESYRVGATHSRYERDENENTGKHQTCHDVEEDASVALPDVSDAHRQPQRGQQVEKPASDLHGASFRFNLFLCLAKIIPKLK
jgi:hypothetical protein